MFERQQPGDISMRSNLQFSNLRAAVLAFIGLVAGSAAHADPGKLLGAATPVAMAAAPQQCNDTDAILAKLRYPAGTTFKLTDAGLVVLNQPRAANAANWEPEWPNTGN
jgi:hypothetical protein